MSPVAAPRRAPARVAAPPPPAQSGGSVNFLGDDSFYFGGMGIPEGNYVCYFTTQMFQPTKMNGQPSGFPAFLAVMLTPYPIQKTGEIGEPMDAVPLGCGTNAHKSFQPSADSKGFDAIPGGTASGMAGTTNWNLFRNSMKECNGEPLPASSDLSVLDGIWVHIQNVPEPEERTKFKSSRKSEAQILAEANGDVVEDVVRGPKLVPVVTEILEGGKPWEGGGGLGQAAPAPVAVAAPRPVAGPHAVAAPARRVPVAPPAPVAAPIEEEAAVLSDEDLAIIAMQGATDYLSATAKAANWSGTSIQLRTGVFAAVAKAQGNDIANAVLEMYFGSEENVNVLVNQLGFKQVGNKVSR